MNYKHIKIILNVSEMKSFVINKSDKTVATFTVVWIEVTQLN